MKIAIESAMPLVCASFNHTEQKLLLLLKKIVFLSFWLERIQFFIVEKAITTWLMIPAKKPRMMMNLAYSE